MFQVGDRVYFAGDVGRNGSNADYVAVDERIVAKAPDSLSFAQAAAVPLTMLTAWEGMFEMMRIPTDGAQQGKHLLVVPGAGGVGSWAIQLGKKVAGLSVVATASRPESIAKAKELGADVVINHREPLKPQLEAAGVAGVDYIYDAYSMFAYGNQYAEVLKPFGQIVSIVPHMDETIPASATIPLFFKRASIHFELMFTRAAEGIEMERQHDILTKAASLLDQGELKVSIQDTLGWSLESVKEAHRLQQSGKAIGKIVIARE